MSGGKESQRKQVAQLIINVLFSGARGMEVRVFDL